MPNFIDCIGYALGKLHTGMLCYICQLFNEGHQSEATTLFGGLGLSNLPRQLKLRREWKGIDLVIFDRATDAPICMIEMKVDDHEHPAGGTNKSQTIASTELLPECRRHLFITLGAGEYYDKPEAGQFVWVRIRHFYKSLRAMKTSEPLIRSWIDAIGEEIQLQDGAASGDTSLRGKYRTGTWNAYFLGRLKEALLSTTFRGRGRIHATAYRYGTRPDTILNFGSKDDHLYMEINNDGRLRLKANMDSFQNAKRPAFIADRMRTLKPKFLRFAPVVNQRAPRGSSHTIMSFDIGLTDIGSNQYRDRTLGYSRTPEDTVATLRKILGTFYG